MPEAVSVQQFYLGCLAHASYLISSGGEAAVIDPQRDVAIYIETAEREHLAIRHIIETHLHADFVSGHVELADRTGARIYLGEGSGADFPHQAVKDGDSITFGSCRLDFLQTPGHTAESVCAVLTDLTSPAPAPSSPATPSSSVTSAAPTFLPRSRPSNWPHSSTAACTRSCCAYPTPPKFFPLTAPARSAAAR